MPALTWLDSSSAARQRTMEVIKLFEEKGTQDEIGIGTVRDAIADILFPGTSTLHTRARYFLIIPWIYQYLEGKRVPSAEITQEARKLEGALVEKILESADSEGVIGKRARARLKILPSTMYWSGTEAWGLRVYSGTKEQYHRSLTRFYDRRDGGTHDDDRNPLDGIITRNWHFGLPSTPAGFPKSPLGFTLTPEEAEYLRDRLLHKCPGTLLAYIVDNCRPAPEVEFVWQHPEFAGFPTRNQEELLHARNFSDAIYGASVLYNVLLAEAKGQREWTEDHREEFEKWAAELGGRLGAINAWDRNAFWNLVIRQNPRISTSTRTFIDRWLDLVSTVIPKRLLGDKRARQLIAERERQIKGRLARLNNQSALDQWLGASGLIRLSYRWNPEVRRVTADIQEGLGRDA